MALPDRVTVNLIEGLERLNNIIEGVTSDNTLLYAPEIKFYDTKYEVTKNLETKLVDVFIIVLSDMFIEEPGQLIGMQFQLVSQ